MPLKVWLIVQDVRSEANLRRQVARWEACGVGGVLITDHMFISQAGSDKGLTRELDRDSPSPLEPFTLLGSVGALSPSLELGTIVANVGLLHPIFVIRHFAQLASVFGGDRIIAGLGAGWNAEEFEAIGLEMPPHTLRLARLEEAARAGQATVPRRGRLDGRRHADRTTTSLVPFPDFAPASFWAAVQTNF